jgi:hypothetical protein
MTRLAHARVIRSLTGESNVLYDRRVHWRMLFLAGLLAVFGPGAAGAATFTVDSYGSFPDAVPGDGICQTAYFLPECTPLAAVEEANALPGPDVILFALPGFNLAGTGQLVVTDDVTMIGAPFPALVFLDANASDRVLRVAPGVTVRVERLNLQNAYTSSAAARFSTRAI